MANLLDFSIFHLDNRMKNLTRRAFFRGARTVVAGGIAFAATAALWLPALPKAVHYTLLDLAKIVDPDGDVMAVVNILNESNEILQDLTWIHSE